MLQPSPLFEIKDTVDTFVGYADHYVLELTDGSVKVNTKSPLESLVGICAQMFYDHEGKFEEDNKEQTQKIALLFSLMNDVVRK